MTNILTAIVTTVLVTNTWVEWPKVGVFGRDGASPQDKSTGDAPWVINTADMPWRWVDDTNATTRTRVTRVERLTLTSVEQLKLTVTNKVEWVSETHVEEFKGGWEPRATNELKAPKDPWNWENTRPTNVHDLYWDDSNSIRIGPGSTNTFIHNTIIRRNGEAE